MLYLQYFICTKKNFCANFKSSWICWRKHKRKQENQTINADIWKKLSFLNTIFIWKLTFKYIMYHTRAQELWWYHHHQLPLITTTTKMFLSFCTNIFTCTDIFTWTTHHSWFPLYWRVVGGWSMSLMAGNNTLPPKIITPPARCFHSRQWWWLWHRPSSHSNHPELNTFKKMNNN